MARDVKAYQEEMEKVYAKSIGSKEKAPFVGIPCIGEDKCNLCTCVKDVLFDKTIPQDHPLRKRARDLRAKDRFYSNIVFISNPSDVVVFEYTDKYIASRLVGWQMAVDSDYKDFFDPKTGRNITIEKRSTGPSIEQVEYVVEPRANSTPLIDPKVLSKMYDLDNIVELIKFRKVVPVYQSKLPDGQKVELRVLPSWLGPGLPYFFKRIHFHFNITEEDYKATLKGDMNPVRNQVAVAKVEEPKPQQRKLFSQVTEEKPTESLDDWGFKTEPTDGTSAAAEEEPPACFGEFDSDNPECAEECKDWQPRCEVKFKDRIASRKAMQRLQKK